MAKIPRSPPLAALVAGGGRELGLTLLLAGGDDYELCFTAAASARGAVAAVASDVGVPLARIGSVTAGASLVVRDERGAPLASLPRSFEHFG